ncbi:regulator of chromosome condensation RCC1 repeat protein [Nitzschia inconspicua]|uniref:Regulator of chromosome condensation RCC1 repeat protein n=1 Tax=Nitzschia inconspicua TaxID=303405 RepID=A0A9K3LWX8_9STRA|nr:regulator of chromosome condensation RCC1 repeat protein [Nitzschia inconspicua]
MKEYLQQQQQHNPQQVQDDVGQRIPLQQDYYNNLYDDILPEDNENILYYSQYSRSNHHHDTYSYDDFTTTKDDVVNTMPPWRQQQQQQQQESYNYWNNNHHHDSFSSRLWMGLYRTFFGGHSSSNNFHGNNNIAVATSSQSSSSSSSNWGILLALIIVCAFQWQSILWAVWYKIKQDGMLPSLIDGVFCIMDILRAYYQMTLEILRSIRHSLGMENRQWGLGVMGMATTTTPNPNHRPYQQQQQQPYHQDQQNNNNNNRNNGKNQQRRIPIGNTFVGNAGMLTTAGGGATSTFAGFFGQITGVTTLNNEPPPPLVILVPNHPTSNSLTGSHTDYQQNMIVQEVNDNDDDNVNYDYDHIYHQHGTGGEKTIATTTTSSSTTTSSWTNPIEPAFLHEEDYPPGWLVYHPHLGVVTKEEADAYDKVQNKNNNNNNNSNNGQQHHTVTNEQTKETTPLDRRNGDLSTKQQQEQSTKQQEPSTNQVSNSGQPPPQQQQQQQQQQVSNGDKDTPASSSSSSSSSSSNDPIWCPEQQIYIGGVVPGATNQQVQDMIQQAGGILRVFGYGSLCWNPGSPDTALGHASVQACKGHAPNYRRIWGQRSTDHRGVPSFPGVVCTLLNQNELRTIGRGQPSSTTTSQSTSSPSSSSSSTPFVEGMIYTVPPELVKQCLEELDFREKGGYAREILEVVEDESKQTVHALLYRGTLDNPAFSSKLANDLRYASAVMAVSNGPSGPNLVYLRQLYEFLQQAKLERERVLRNENNNNNNKDNKDNKYDDSDDTFALTETATALGRHSHLYFFCGAGSNQHGQLINYYKEDQDFPTLTESFVACIKDDTANDTNTIMSAPKHLYCGGGHSALLTKDDKLYLWGWNEHGQCGSIQHSHLPINDDDGSIPTPLLKPLSILVDSVALGFSHTLIIEKDTGRLYAFGDDSHGQVTGRQVVTVQGNTNVYVPTVPSIVSSNDRFLAVAAGLFHSAAITTEGELVTFGSGKKGQCLLQQEQNKWKPSDCKFVSVVCGRHHTAMLDDRGRIWTMGENKFGQLGRALREEILNGNSSSRQKAMQTPVPELVDGPLGKDQSLLKDDSAFLHRCVELTSGWSHLVARVEIQSIADSSSVSHAVFGWGRSDKGQLGTQEKSIISTPERIDTFLTSNSEGIERRVVSISCASDSTYFLVQSTTNSKEDYGIYSVGWNEHGNLGVGPKKKDATDEDDIFLPVQVPGLSRLVSPSTYTADASQRILLAAGGAHVLVMRV